MTHWDTFWFIFLVFLLPRILAYCYLKYKGILHISKDAQCLRVPVQRRKEDSCKNTTPVKRRNRIVSSLQNTHCS